MANVLSIVPYKIFPAKLGGQKGIALFNKYFSGHHNLICVTVKDNEPSYADYTILNILSNSKFRYINIFYFFTLKKIIKKYKITYVIAEHPYFGWLAILLKKFCRIKLTVHSHNIESMRFKTVGKWWWGILWNYEKLVYRSANLVFCITENDRQYMISKFKTSPEKCIVITYGIEWNTLPDKNEKLSARKFLIDTYGLTENTVIYLFNGTLSYPPNFNAVKALVNSINPAMMTSSMNYRIIICGKNLPDDIDLKNFYDKNIIYAGFVDDISVYFKGADVFVNPVSDGGGIKTKLVEALGYNLNAVSTTNGSIGVDKQLCNGKLLVTADNDWPDFAAKMVEATMISADISSQYFGYFYWENIAKKAAKAILNL